MTTPTPNSNHVDRALEEIQDWRKERREREIAFFASALAHDELHIVPGHEFTTQKCKCDVCFEPQPKGIRKYWYSGKRKEVDVTHFWFFPCATCWKAIMANADVQVLVASQVSAPVSE